MLITLLSFVYLVTPVLGGVIPIQKREPGTRYNGGSVGAPIKLEVFIDLHCPDSSTVWPELKKVAQNYGTDNVDLIVHQFPLPYHQYAHLAAEGFYLVKDFMNATWAFNYMEWVLERWYLFRSSSVETKTPAQIKSLLATYLDSVPGSKLNSAQFVNYLDFYRSPAVYAWKYAVQRGVSGTPWYFVNGIDLGTSHPLTYSELSNLLDRLMD